MLYILHVHSAICQLYLNKTGRKNKFIIHEKKNCSSKKKKEIQEPESAPRGHREWQGCDDGGDYNVRKGFPVICEYHVRKADITVVSPR